MDEPPIVFIVGPTAVGKTDVGFLLADRMKGEIISCDAMQVYREVSIATSKPSLEMQKKVRHHLIDIVSVAEAFNVARFNEEVLAALAQVRARGRMPFIVGGSGLYMQVLLDGIFAEASRDPRQREELLSRLAQEGNARLHAELKKVDPQAAVKIHQNDSRRIVRALEVYHATREAISSLQKQREGLWGREKILLFALRRSREDLYTRVNRRVEEMFEQGIVKEISSLEGVSLSHTAESIIGVKEIRAYLKGTCSLEEAKEEMKLNTRHLAKRQMTWFRKEKRLEWEDVLENDSSLDVSRRIQQKTERALL